MKHTTKTSQTLATKGLQRSYSYLVQLGKPDQLAICNTLQECSDAVVKHHDDNDMGSNAWHSQDKNVGCIFHPLLGIIGRVSYNGRVWDTTNTMKKEIKTGLNDLLTIDINTILNSKTNNNMAHITLTLENINAALKGDNFWLHPDSEEAKIIKAAEDMKYITRASHTQAEWTQYGIDKLTQRVLIDTRPTARKALARIKKFGYPVILLLCLLSFTGSAQTAKIGKDGNYYAASSSKSTQPAKSTGKTYTDSKGNIYPVMQSDKGKLFILRTSKKTGKEYKQYLKL